MQPVQPALRMPACEWMAGMILGAGVVGLGGEGSGIASHEAPAWHPFPCLEHRCFTTPTSDDCAAGVAPVATDGARNCCSPSARPVAARPTANPYQLRLW